MRIIFAALAACLLFGAAAQAAVVDVLSGDAFRIENKVWRIANINAPLLEHVCTAEVLFAQRAQAKLAEILAKGEMEIRPTGLFDGNARALAFVRINGADVGEAMIAAGFAQPKGAMRPVCMAALPTPAEQIALADAARERQRQHGHMGVVRGMQPAHSTPPAPVVGIRR